MRNIRFISNGEYSVYITNCIDDEVEIEFIPNEYLFDQVGVDLLAAVSSINVKTDKIIKYTNDKQNEFVIYNINLTPNDNNQINDDLVDINNETQNNMIMSCINLSSYKLSSANNMININNVKATLSNISITENETGRILNTDNSDVLVDELNVNNNIFADNVISINHSVVDMYSLLSKENVLTKSFVELLYNNELTISKTNIDLDLAKAFVKTASDNNIININELNIDKSEIENVIDNVVDNNVLYLQKSLIQQSTISNAVINSVADSDISLYDVGILDNNILNDVINTTNNISVASVSIVNNTVDNNIFNIIGALNIEDLDIVNNKVSKDIFNIEDVLNISTVSIINNILTNRIINTKDNILVSGELTIDNNEIGKDAIYTENNLVIDSLVNVSSNITKDNLISVENDIVLDGKLKIELNKSTNSIIVADNIDFNGDLIIDKNEYGYVEAALINVRENVFNISNFDILHNRSVNSSEFITLKTDMIINHGNVLISDNYIKRSENGYQELLHIEGEGVVVNDDLRLVIKNNTVDSCINTNNKQVSVIRLGRI